MSGITFSDLLAIWVYSVFVSASLSLLHEDFDGTQKTVAIIIACLTPGLNTVCALLLGFVMLIRLIKWPFVRFHRYMVAKRDRQARGPS